MHHIRKALICVVAIAVSSPALAGNYRQSRRSGLKLHDRLAHKLLKKKNRTRDKQKQGRLDPLIRRIQRHNAKAIRNDANNALLTARRAHGEGKTDGLTGHYEYVIQKAAAALTPEKTHVYGVLGKKVRRQLEQIAKTATRAQLELHIKEVTGTLRKTLADADSTNDQRLSSEVRRAVYLLEQAKLPAASPLRKKLDRRLNTALMRLLRDTSVTMDLHSAVKGNEDKDGQVADKYRVLAAAERALRELPKDFKLTRDTARAWHQAKKSLAEVEEHILLRTNAGGLLFGRMLEFYDGR